MKKIIDVVFDIIVTIAFRAIVIIVGEGIIHKSNLSTSDAVWVVAILVGMIFAEFFTVAKKK